MFSPSFCLELRSFLISSLKCEIFVVKSELSLSRTILVQVKFHDGKVDTFRKELVVV